MTKVRNDPDSVESLISRFARTTDEIVTLSELRERLLSGEQLVMKYGVDLTAPDMHIGHAVNLWMYRDLQDMGHKVLLLLGDFTTRIGDPTGRSKTRPVLTEEEIQENAAGIYRQAMQILSADPAVFEMRRNSEWLDALSPVDLLRLMSTVTVDKLMSRDMFRKRVLAGLPTAMHELVYPLLQGWDSVALNADLTIIGSDQLFNEMMGRELQGREGQRPQSIITTKITPGLDGGEKQSKSLGNYVAVDHSPRDKYGRLMSIRDDLVVQYADVYTGLQDDELKQIRSSFQVSPKLGKELMAEAVVARYHGWDVAKAERAWFTETFSTRSMPTDAPRVVVESASLKVLDLVRRATEGSLTLSEIRRLAKQGAIRLNGDKLGDADEEVSIVRGTSELRIGKRQWFHVDRP